MNLNRFTYRAHPPIHRAVSRSAKKQMMAGRLRVILAPAILATDGKPVSAAALLAGEAQRLLRLPHINFVVSRARERQIWAFRLCATWLECSGSPDRIRRWQEIDPKPAKKRGSKKEG